MVLQQAPAKAAVAGVLDMTNTESSLTPKVKVSVTGGGNSYSVDATVVGSSWKAYLKPTPAGGDYTIEAECVANCPANSQMNPTLSHVTFGDVWYCSGQSNMALPLLHTMSRNKSMAAISAGRYSNIRLFGIKSNMNKDLAWTKVKDAVDNGDFLGFSSTCYYFAESLSDALGAAAPPLGLVHTAYGGSTIEQWLDNKTIATCRNATLSSTNQEWHDSRVLPFTAMTLKGWIWYQGENDMHGVMGNSKLGYGYSCLMPALVKTWRSLWSAEEGTTSPQAPFGLVTLAPGGGEGAGINIAPMRHAQTASYGVLPNPVMPNTFFAQAFDAGDPYRAASKCGKKKCCDAQNAISDFCTGCKEYCESKAATKYYMGPIHPRDKKVIGSRLAQSSAVSVYGQQGASTGPTLAGCQKTGNEITLQFDQKLLGNDKVIVQDYDRTHGASKMDVLVNASAFCMQVDHNGVECFDDGFGKYVGHGNFESDKIWVPVDIKEATTHSITIDLAKSGGVAYAVRYAWAGKDCCSENGTPETTECPVASCPLMSSAAKLPANPFIAKINKGKCQCLPPQVCDGEGSADVLAYV